MAGLALLVVEKMTSGKSEINLHHAFVITGVLL